MRGKTHRIITKKVAMALNLPKGLEKILLNAVIYPDIKRDYKINYKKRYFYISHENHHRVDPEKIINYVFKARLEYLAKNYEYSMVNLGIALHYIQDRCMASGTLHDEREDKLLNLEISEEAINRGKKEEINLFSDLKNILYQIKPYKSPEKIIYNACYYSSLVLKAVLNPNPPPKELLEMYEKYREKYSQEIIPLIITITVLTLVFSLFFKNLFIIIIGAIIVLSITGFNNKELEENIRWYGIEKGSSKS
jgi:uncharacterized membrane protein